jgi:hypothetical protein
VGALVISGATTPDTAISHSGLEGGGGPEVERVGGLDIIVAIEDHVGPFLGATAASDDDGVKGGGMDLDIQTGALEQATGVLSGPDHARLVGRIGGDARVAHIRHQLLDEIHGF